MLHRRWVSCVATWGLLIACLPACKACKSESVVVPTAAPSASQPAVPVSPAPHAGGTFTSVIVGTKAEHVNFFPVGSRALIARGTTFWGYASAGHTYVQDAHIGEGLPIAGTSHLQAVGGLWPEVAAVSGEKELAVYAGPDPVLFVQHGAAFAASKVTLPEVPHEAVTSKGVTYLFATDGMYFIAGLDLGRCGKSTPAELPVLAVRGDQKLTAPRGAPSFFPQALENDASGNGFVVGGDMCRPGAFLASLDASPLRLELVPSSDACAERTTAEGMPFTHAHLFPASGGGLYVLLENRAASPNYEDEAKLRTGACAAPPRMMERSADGHWSAPRALPENVSYIDPSGTAWAITDHRTVSRIPKTGATTELALDPSCARPPGGAKLAIDESAAHGGILWLFVPFPDQPWIMVAYEGEHTGLCVANLDLP